jgi:adenylate cyclase
MEDHLPRKLAVILHADVVGSTLLVQQNETLAHERIQSTFHRFSETIKSYEGVAHELRGDALVAEFERASDAVAAALACQVENKQFNQTLDDDIRPQVRIGISLGEVVIADNTITGAGVVLAQRLEQLAESGGVCIQGAAYETVPQRLPFEFENLGEQQVKGFEEPVRVYAVTQKAGAEVHAPEPTHAAVKASRKGRDEGGTADLSGCIDRR